jgi:DNA-binding GntR family transcriptional regulator
MINHVNLSERIVQELEKMIISGFFKPGERIVETELCKTFGVSITPIREALKVLQSQGFIKHEPRKGASVTKMSNEEAEEIYRINAYLESLAVNLAVKNKDPKVLEELKRIHKKMVSLASKNKIDDNYKKLHIKFHDTLLSASKSERLIRLIKDLAKQAKPYRSTILAMPERSNSSLKIHETIIRCIEEGNAEKAENLRKKSILRSIEDFSKKFLDNEKK